MNQRRVLRAVLFDLDGTLLDTAKDMVEALNELRREEHLLPLPYAMVRGLVSHGAARLVQAGFATAGAERAAALQARYLTLYRDCVSRQTRLFDGMDEVLRSLQARDIKTGIVTNKPAWLTEPLLEDLGLRAQLACVVSGDTLEQRKPHPAPMLYAAQLAGVSAADCIYVGDAERDIQAAHAAAMPALVAAYGYLEAGENWQAWGAEGHLNRPLDLLPWIEQNTAT